MTRIKRELTANRLREVIHYDPNTGVFTWRIRAGGAANPGVECGSYDTHGHLQIRVDGGRYRGHRLAWLYMTGSWPVSDIDHRDTVRRNNSWDNLREATRTQNCANQTMRKDNTSGKKGVSWHKATGKWMASICSNRRQRHLGLFENIDDAHAAYAAAAERLFGEFARVG